MSNYNYDNLSKNIGAKFKVTDEHGNTCELTLTEVDEGELNNEEWEAFSATYETDGDYSLHQGIYTISHDCFGEEELFLCHNSEKEVETVVNRKR